MARVLDVILRRGSSMSTFKVSDRTPEDRRAAAPRGVPAVA
jgi:hypothetical protein